MRILRMRVTTMMALVLYAAIDLGALQAARTYDSFLGIGVFVVLSFLVPLVAAMWWLVRAVRQIDRNTLF
jgi:hypothetical protein